MIPSRWNFFVGVARAIWYTWEREAKMRLSLQFTGLNSSTLSYSSLVDLVGFFTEEMTIIRSNN